MEKIDILKFINENKTDLFTPNIPDHNINQSVLDELKQKVSELPDYYPQIAKEDERESVEEFVKIYKVNINNMFTNLRYVSFIEFKSKLDKISKHIIEYINEKNIKKIYFVILNNLKKSNFWIFLLSIKNFIESFYNTDKHIELINTLDHQVHEENSIFIYPDDMIYSGMQFSQRFTKLNHIPKTTHIKLLIPFITKFGKQIIKTSINYLPFEDDKFYENNGIEIIPTVESNYSDGKKNMMEYKYNKFSKIIDFDSYIFAQNIYRKPYIYFQHKLADLLSINSIFFNNGAYLSYKDNKISINSLDKAIANNCKANISCPEASYKKIKYTYKGESINLDKLKLDDFKIDLEKKELELNGGYIKHFIFEGNIINSYTVLIIILVFIICYICKYKQNYLPRNKIIYQFPNYYQLVKIEK
jgi:hypothetical protein